MATAESIPPQVKLPGRFNLGWYCCDRWVEKGLGHRPAIYHEGGTLTYRDLAELSNKIGNTLRGLGLERGDRYLIRLTNRPETYATFLAGLKVGAVPIPTSTLLQTRELRYILNVADVRLVVVEDSLAEPILALRHEAHALEHVLRLGIPSSHELSFHDEVERGPPSLSLAGTGVDDPAFVLFTSGTSGTPKGIAHAHRAFNVAAGNPCGRWGMGLTADDVVFQPHDLAWSYTLGCGVLFPLAQGASVLAQRGRATPQEVLDLIEQHRVTIFASVPTLYRRLLVLIESEVGADLSGLRFCMSAGEPLAPEVYMRWKQQTDVELLEHMGQSELCMFTANPPHCPPRPGSVGTAVPGYRVAVIDEDAKELVDEVGHLVVEEDNPALFYEYIGMPEKFTECHRNGWYYTGDLAWMDDDGYFWFVSRADDLITSRGYLISPFEVEQTLVGHEGVLEAAVVGVPDAETGDEVVKAFVVPRPGLQPSSTRGEELRRYVKSTLAPYKAPREVEFVDHLPKTSTGKIRRRGLRPQPNHPST